ncbi:hypothetical protein FALCPG4_006084 [Fusarium falciforme]
MRTSMLASMTPHVMHEPTMRRIQAEIHLPRALNPVGSWHTSELEVIVGRVSGGCATDGTVERGPNIRRQGSSIFSSPTYRLTLYCVFEVLEGLGEDELVGQGNSTVTTQPKPHTQASTHDNSTMRPPSSNKACSNY